MNSSATHAQPDRSAYLAWYFWTLILACIVVLTVNAIVDPYARLRLIDENGFNQAKVTLEKDSRKGKTTALRQCRYDSLILGASHAEIAMALDAPPLNTGRTYNAALKAASMYETMRLAQYALQHQDLDFVLLSLDFVAFNTDLMFQDDFAESPLAPAVDWLSMAKYLLSLRTLMDSAQTLNANMFATPTLCASTGVHSRSRELKPARFTFDANLKRYATGPYKRHAFGDLHVDHLQALLRELTDAQVKVYAFISPSHVTQVELLIEMNMLEGYENWKRDLVRVVAESNQGLPEDRQISLWDFSGYNVITTEPIPEREDAGFMNWYTDPSHATPEIGNLVTARMLGLPPQGTIDTASFGVRLTPDNIEADIKAARRDSERYRRDNSTEIELMREMLRNNDAGIHPRQE